MFVNSYIVIAQNLKTNLDFFGELYFQLFRGVFHGEKIPDSSRLIIQESESSAANWLIENEIFKWAKSAGFVNCVVQGNAREDEGVSGFLLQYKNLKSLVEYSEASVSGKISRCVHAELYLKLLSPSRQILFSGIQKKTLCDEIRPKDVQRVENEKYPFTMGKRNRSFLAKILEPTIVSLVTGGIIYLFYSYRSQ